jgi:putative ABC transport system permease protein
VHERIEPLILFINPSWQNLVYVRISPDNTREALAVVERTFKKFAPENPFEFTFLDDDFDRLYRAEQRTGKIFNYFAIIAIFISCLGLFGLVMFTTEQRTKEIGVRKVLGASVQSVVSLISADFIKLIIISNVVAIPVAWYMMNMWLANFAYKISIHWVTFFIAGGSSLLIAWLTIAYQSIKAAVANPVDSLRNE